MIPYIRVFAISLLLLCSYVGWSAYGYFFDTSSPVITVSGIETDGCYAGDIPCTVNMSDEYSVADISVTLDNKALVSHFKINRKQDEHSFVVPTKTMSNGPHALKIEVRDGSYRKNNTTETIPFIIDNRPLQAAFVKSDTDLKVFQGRTLHLQFQVNKPIYSAVIKILSKEFACTPESENSLIYECFIPISTEEAPNEYPFSIEITDMVGNTATLDSKLQVIMFPFKKQVIAIKSEKLKEEHEAGIPEKELEDKLEKASKESPEHKLWRGNFYAPIDIKSISTEFGTVRTTQHRGKYAHNAVDLIGTPKTVVWAPQDGIVVIKDRFVHSGNTVVIDHGCGVLSMFYHLDSFANINVGDTIRKGKPVGTLGKTGYATGFHLHWEMRIHNIAIDPMQWIKNDF